MNVSDLAREKKGGLVRVRPSRQGVKAAIANDNVVQELDPEQPRSALQLRRDGVILRAGFRISGWVIVASDHSRSVRQDGRLEYLARMNHGRAN